MFEVVAPLEPSFRRASTDGPVDPEAHIRRLPPGATAVGLFFNAALRRLTAGEQRAVLAEAGVTTTRFLSFIHYPYPDFLRLLHASARYRFPDQPIAQGVRLLGQEGFRAFADSMIGRGVFSVVTEVEDILLAGPRAWRVSVNFASIRAARRGERCVEYEFRDFPGYLETYQVGILEGGVLSFREMPRFEIQLLSLDHARVRVRW